MWVSQTRDHIRKGVTMGLNNKQEGGLAVVLLVILGMLVAIPLLGGIIYIEFVMGVKIVENILDGYYWVAFGWSTLFLVVMAALKIVSDAVGANR
jgi:hypothetical protein